MLTGFMAREQAAVDRALVNALRGLPPSVRDVADYALLAGGKRLRPFLTLTVLRLFGSGKPASYELAVCLEMVHAASLLHDDVLDDAATRRGRQAAHLKYGIAPSLLAGDALMAWASKTVAGYGNPALVECLADAIVRTVAGEAQEIALRGSLDHGLDTYLELATGKTAWLIRASCRMAALYAEADQTLLDALSSYGLHMGIAFQMVDDALDFADEALTGKPCGGDLREGKATPPILRYADSLDGEERAAFARKFANGGFTDEDIECVSRSIRAMRLDEWTRGQAEVYLRKAALALDLLPRKPERDILSKALDYVRDRKK